MSHTKLWHTVTDYIEQTIYRDQLLGYKIVMHEQGNISTQVLFEDLKDEHDLVSSVFSLTACEIFKRCLLFLQWNVNVTKSVAQM